MCLFKSFDSYQPCMSRIINRWFQQIWSCLRIGERKEIFQGLEVCVFLSVPGSQPRGFFPNVDNTSPPPWASLHPDAFTTSSPQQGGFSIPFSPFTSHGIQSSNISAWSQGKGLLTKPLSWINPYSHLVWSGFKALRNAGPPSQEDHLCTGSAAEQSLRLMLQSFKEETRDWKGFSRKEINEHMQNMRSVLIGLTKLHVLTEICLKRMSFLGLLTLNLVGWDYRAAGNSDFCMFYLSGKPGAFQREGHAQIWTAHSGWAEEDS